MADKIFNQLPVVLQTKAIKNFFEATVEQLYSEANITPISGFIGKQTGEDKKVQGAFVAEDTADRRIYNLTPAINNLNTITGESENLMFYDEFIDILNVYGVDTKNHNKIFGSRYRTFMPPIDIDKFVNYQEYYWYPDGPSTITITPTTYINIDKDVVGKKSYSYGNVTLRNGMIVQFADNNNVIPASTATTAEHRAGTEYIVGGVGESIYLVEKSLSSATLYGGSKADNKDYITIERGSQNKNAWSRVNHWYHRNNFLDADDSLPDRKYRSMRPILEFNKDLEIYNHGDTNYDVATVAVVALSKAEVEGQANLTIDTRVVQDGDVLFFPNESEANKVYLYKVSGATSSIVLTATSSTAIKANQTVVIAKGNVYEGADYLYNGTIFTQAQKKVQVNQPPLFNLYDDAGNKLNNTGLYNNSDFVGNKIFGYKIGTGKPDTELGFPLSYTPYKAVSEITFENFIQTDRVQYQNFGSSTKNTVLGSYYYKLLKDTPEYHSYWKLSDDKNEQKIITTHYVTRQDVDEEKIVYNIGATPNASTITSSGYDILVKVNGAIVTNYVYQSPSSIKFNEFDFSKGDIIDVEVASDSGIEKISDSRYEIPLSWKTNPFNSEIELVAEPQYLSHFKRFIEKQEGFTGDVLASNNFSSTAKDVTHAKNIVQTEQDIILAAFLLDDQPHNLIESLRFSAKEYGKYRSRLVKEIQNYYNSFPVENLTNEYILEKVLRNLISFSVGKNVFGSTFILPFGDNYIEETFDVSDLSNTSYTLSNYEDLETLQNSLLVYKFDPENGKQELLTNDEDYTISSANPITVDVSATVKLGDSIITKLYNEERDSAECPPTPSTMGIYPLYIPRIETDNSFQTPIKLLVGHDGSKTTLTNTIVDDILLEFETRIYNTSLSKFRDANSLPALNVGDVRAGKFRSNNFAPREYTDLLRNSFNDWAKINKVDHVTNEHFDATNTWTWNYRGKLDLPGHWRGWYEYYYDTVRPHTHPWEMLGFIEKPSWWETQYGTSYGSKNFSMWEDLEEGIIRQGSRENFTTGAYKNDNNWRRVGLSDFIPVNADAELLSPGQITSTGTTTREEIWNNRRLANQTVSDTFYDSTGQSNLPNGINVTYGSSAALRVLFDANAAPQAGTFWDYDGTISPSIQGSGFAEGLDGFETPYIFVEDKIENTKYQLYNYTFDNLTQAANIIVQTPTAISSNAIGITVTGTPILNPGSAESWNNEGDWNYTNTYRGDAPANGTYFIEPEHAGLTEWDTDNHSPVVGWSFDGLPIYGPYGYTEYAANGQVVNNDITNIQSGFKLKENNRSSGPGGDHTGEFIQDYTYNPANASTYAGEVGTPNSGELGKYNLRYGITPDSPTTPIWFYVATIDNDGDPMFPFAIGGTVGSSDNTYQGKYWTEPVEPTKNNTGSITEEGSLVAISSNLTVAPNNDTDLANSVWRFGDGAPVENAWKYSVAYPFAVVEALLLSRPGKFVTQFSDPTRITSPLLDKTKIINSTTRTPFDFVDQDHFCIHGAVDNTGNTVINSGYTQFVHSWLTYQDLNTTTDYAEKLRKVNIKLAHRLAGFTDKDTLSVRADQTSLTTTSQSLVIPNENVDVVVHSSPYKNRNSYSGMHIQKTANGYKIKGYDKNFGYFEVLRRNYKGQTSSVEVGGNAVDYQIWEPGKSYPKETIVSYNNGYYRAPTLVPSSQTFMSSLWNRLPSLPQTGSVKATLFLDSLPYVDRIDYQTEYKTYQEVVDVIVGLGAYQESLGFDFGNFDSSINDVRNWNYVVRQFLFWVSGGWENNNTLELSPCANRLVFNSSTGMIAAINRTDKNQFSLIDQDGKAIEPKLCEIVREGNTIEIVPPEGSQIYSTILYTKEIEHALVFDNVTNFNDVLFDPVHGHAQPRLKVKGKRTANWSGLFSTEGFIIQNDELKPNLDNMAQSLGRYHELGFIPVEKQIYEQARGLFGYQEKEYLNVLEVEDDDQFEFYKGMLQNKGTVASLSRIAKSTNIVQGEMTVYDEWAIKAGDFGDLENDQAIELKLQKSEITNDPQLITLAFPEDTTGVLDRVKIIKAKHKYHRVPRIEIAAPTGTPAEQATAVAQLEANGVLKSVSITNAGSGYKQPVRLQVIAAELNISNISTTFNKPIAVSTDAITDADVTGTLSLLDITSTVNGSNVSVSLDLSSVTSVANVVTAINSNATINSSITASSITSNVLEGGNVIQQHVLSISGNDFTLSENGATLSTLNLTPNRYQPHQRYSISAVDNHPTLGTGATTVDDIIVTVAGSTVSSDNGNNWIYDAGSRQQFDFNISTSGAIDFDNDFVNSGNVNIPLSQTLDANNIVKQNDITYPHANVFVDGVELINTVGDIRYTLTTSQLTIHNVETLPGNRLAAGANIYLVESPTIDFEDAYFGDVPGASLNIKTTTSDDIAILTKTKRIYEITPDVKTDDVILIDIDDTERFLKKPIGVRENNLWPTTANVDYTGINDSRFTKIPNAGYVNSSNVDFSAFDVPSIGDLFNSSLLIQPDANSTVHVAISENRHWNVYKFKEANTDISFVEREGDDETAYLYSNVSLFNYTDSNQIGNIDLGRFLDYHIAIKDVDTSDKFVVWVNEEVVNNKSVRLSNITPVAMTEKYVSSIGPRTVKAITDINPGISGFASGFAERISNNTVKIYTTVDNLSVNVNTTVGFATSNITPDEQILFGNTYQASNIDIANSTFTINETLSGNVEPANMTVRFFNRTQITSDGHGFLGGQTVKIVAGPYSGQWPVESASANTFCIQAPYIASGPTTGNIVTPYITITTSEPHGIKIDYKNKKIAIHNSKEKFYNRVYRVDKIPSANTIVVAGAYPFNDQTINMDANTTVMNTLDHDVISLNNSNIKIDNITSLDGMIEALNRGFALRRGWIKAPGSFTMGIPMLKNPLHNSATGGMLGQTRGSSPYVNNFAGISTTNLVQTGNLPVGSPGSQLKGFNKTSTGQSKISQKAQRGTLSSGASVTPMSTKLNTSYFNPSTSVGGYSTATSGAGNNFTNPGTRGKTAASSLGTNNTFINSTFGGTVKPTASGASQTFLNLLGTIQTITNPPVTTSCPAPEMPIKISQDGKTKPAGNLQVGDKVFTAHEHTGEFGLYDVEYVEIKQEQRTKVTFDDGFEFIGSLTHKFKVNENWVEVQDLKVGDDVQGHSVVSIEDDEAAGDIVVITVTDAHTYIVGELLSHNKSVQQPVPGSGSGIPTLTFPTPSGYATNNTGAVVVNPYVVHTPPTQGCGTLVIPPPPPPPNLPPEAIVDQYFTAFETQFTGNVLDNDSDPEGDSLTVTLNRPPEHHAGTFNLASNGSFTYIPETGYEGGDTFTYDIADSEGNIDTDVLVVIEVGQQPYVPPPTVTVYEKCEYQEQSTTTNGVDDAWYYQIDAVDGAIKLIIDMDAATDSLSVYQYSGTNIAGKQRVAWTGGLLRNATAQEKQDLFDSRGLNPITTTNTNIYPNINWNLPGNVNPNQFPKDYIRDNGVPGGIKYCGVLEFNFDHTKGRNLVVEVDKRSSVYRYMICYPTLTDTGRAIGTAQSNPNPGQLNTGVSNGTTNPNTSSVATTPIINPTGLPTTKLKVASPILPTGPYAGGGGSFRFNVAGLNYSHNFGGFSLAPMAGFTHMPSIFKKTVKTVNPQNVGRLQPLGDNRYVNVTQQRASGGRVIPLAAPIAPPIPIARRAIKGVDIALYPGSDKFGNSSFWGNDLIDEKLLKIASSNYDIQTISVPGFDGSTGTDNVLRTRSSTFIPGTDGSGDGSDSSVVTFTTIPAGDPTIIPGGLVYDSTTLRGLTTQFSDTLTPSETIPSEDAPLDPDIQYTEVPLMTVTPTRKRPAGGGYVYEPAGPTAVAPIYRPTPSITLTENDMIGLTPGDQVIVNTQTITIKGTPAATLKEFECSGGFGYTAIPSYSGNQNAVTISACGSVPLTFRDGCRGGTYKEVLDFHIVKNFSLTDSTQDQYAINGNTYTVSNQLPNEVTTQSTSTTTGTHVAGLTTASVNTTTTTNGNSTTAANTQTASQMVGQDRVPEIRASVNHTGGKGYRVGDRLRVVGGTPVSSPFGSITELCIEIEGMYYSDAANVHVFIGDGTTPGSECEAGKPEIDILGRIKSIPILRSGRGYDPAKPPKVRIIDSGPGYTHPDTGVAYAKIPCKVRPIIKTETMSPSGNMVETAGMPERPAKFVVTAVDPEGTIQSLKVIDRGIYKEFPADLATGVPLEYDGINLGDEHAGEMPPKFSSGLGQYHPVTYERLGSPGNWDPIVGKYGTLSGHGSAGFGARIFLTAREIPDCSERGDVRNKLGIPDQVIEVPTVQHLADALNNALQNAGYDPTDINFDVQPINEDLDELILNAPSYDGVKFDELTPGFLDKLGVPPGDYNPDQTPMSAVDGTPTNDKNLDTDGVIDLIDGTDDNFGRSETPFIPGTPGTLGQDSEYGSDETGYELPEEVLVLYGVDNNGFKSDDSSILGNANVTYVGDLFQYELRNLNGEPVNTSISSTDCRVLYLESQRYHKEEDIASSSTAFPDASIPATKEEFEQVWIDDVDGKWKYYENGNLKRSQIDLVDPKYIKNTILYDSTTGEKDFDYNMWDPFKGIFPAFVDAEIDYFGEHDPVVYTRRRAVFGKEQVGQVWWNTSTVRYNWYEQGTNKERWLNWGSTFPGSGITVYEWVESKQQPFEYSGTGTPKNASEFIVERNIDPSTGQYETYYYYWVQNVREISTLAATQAGRKFSTFDIAKYLADPIGQGINTVSFISAGTQTSKNIASFVMSNLTKTLREDEQNIQINLSRNLNPIGLKHASWKLMREGDNNSDVPEDLANKLIDSLTEIDSEGNAVPASNLSEVERYGIKFRPRQTMFKDAKEARRALHYIVNELLADLKLNTLNTTWQNSMSSMKYIDTVNWYAVQRTDQVTNEKIRYDKTFKAAFTVSSVKQLDSLANVADGTVVMVRASQSDRYQLWRYCCREEGFVQIAIQNETVKLSNKIYTQDIDSTMQSELREFLYVLKDNIFLGTENFNKVFFELMNYALGEQRELDWAFKTSYVYVEKEEEDLVQRVGYKPDNFDSVVEYFNEVKPFTAKIREYKDGKRAPIEYINEQMVSDYDLPPYADSSLGEVRTMDFGFAPDREIMSKNSDYTKAYSGYSGTQTQWDTANVPVRTGNISLIFDRTDWRLLESDFNAASTSYSVSIADNIANINSANNDTIANVASNTYSASARIFKFDPQVRTVFDKEINDYFGEGSSSNTSIVENSTQMRTAVAAGALNGTLLLVKEKVGGTWQGEELDANVFTRVVQGRDSLELQTAYGYDTTPFDAPEGFGDMWDDFVSVDNFEGIFSGNSTYREAGVTYDGFDGWSFNHLLYGEERPEELVYLSPLENLVMSVKTSPNAFDANNNIVDSISVGPYDADSVSNSVSGTVTISSTLASPLLDNGDTVTLSDVGNTIIEGSYTISNVTATTFTIPLSGVDANVVNNAGTVSITSGVSAVAVEYLVHQDLYGATEYLRILADGSTSTTTASFVNAWDTEIEVVDASKLPTPQPGIPGAAWIDGSERIEYNRISGNTLKGVVRGTRGTTIPNGPVFEYTGNVATQGNTYLGHNTGVTVVGAGRKDIFNQPENKGGSAGYEDRDPDTAVWLKSDGTTLSLTDKTNRSTVTTIGAFLHGDLVSSIGFDSVAWDSIGWDSI